MTSVSEKTNTWKATQLQLLFKFCEDLQILTLLLFSSTAFFRFTNRSGLKFLLAVYPRGICEEFLLVTGTCPNRAFWGHLWDSPKP